MIFRRRLIERQRAAGYMFTMMIAFAVSILVTRIFLELTGYPQIGNSDLHIAHVLWGGLIVAVGAALPLVFSNTSIYGISAALSGVGLGLFFDEVGKFLTQDNDYFFRPAASIIYILFLLGIYVYITVRRGEPDDQMRLHHALAAMQEIVDGDLDVQEKKELEALLSGITGDADIPDVRELAGELLGFVQTQADTTDARPTPVRDRLRDAGRWIAAHILTQPITRWLLIVSMGLLGIVSLIDLSAFLSALDDPGQIAALLEGWVARGDLTGAQESLWFALMIGLKAVVGLALIAGLIFFLAGRERRGIALALAGLLLSVTLFDMLLFYFEQFIAAARATLDFIIIAGLSFYNTRYLRPVRQGGKKKDPG
jgi:hypothetical protein